MVVVESHLQWYELELGSDPPSQTIYHRLVAGGENGHRFSGEENPWFWTAGRPRGQASLQFMYVLSRSELRRRLHSRGVLYPSADA